MGPGAGPRCAPLWQRVQPRLRGEKGEAVHRLPSPSPSRCAGPGWQSSLRCERAQRGSMVSARALCFADTQETWLLTSTDTTRARSGRDYCAERWTRRPPELVYSKAVNGLCGRRAKFFVCRCRWAPAVFSSPALQKNRASFFH